MNKGFLLKLAALCILITLIMVCVGKGIGINAYEIKQTVNSFGLYAPLAYSIILIAGLTIPFNPISDFLVVNIAALLFPPHISIIFTFIAHICALTINYHVAKKYGIRIVGKLTEKEKTQTIIKLSKKLTTKKLFFIRFILPTSNLIGSDILSYLAGIQKMHFKRFFILSIIPWTILSFIYFNSTSLLIRKYVHLFLQ